MTRILFLFSFLFITTLIFGQDVDRITIKGRIVTGTSVSVQGIAIYNLTSEKETITDLDGSFEIKAGLNDRLVFKAIHLQLFELLIDEAILKSKTMNVHLNPVTYGLEEVYISKIELTGYLEQDQENIKVYPLPPMPDISYASLNFEYELAPDALSPVRNEALRTDEIEFGIDGMAIIGALVGLFVKNKKSINKDNKTPVFLEGDLRERYKTSFFKEIFGISSDKINDFILYAEDHGLTEKYLLPENQLDLLEFLMQQSKAYRLQSKNGD